MTDFSIASFNTRWGLTSADVPFDVGQVIEGFDSDLISLQEVWEPHDGSSLASHAERGGYQLFHTPLAPSLVHPAPEITADLDRARGTWGVALLSRLPVRTVRTVDLGRLVERWDVAERYAIIAEVEVGEAVVCVTALHLSFALPNAVAQLRRFSGYVPAHQPSVVAGDCNLWGPAATAVLARHRRAVRGRTWPAHRPHSQLDHILVSPEVAVRAASVLHPVGSDHRPVRAVLAVAEHS